MKFEEYWLSVMVLSEFTKVGLSFGTKFRHHPYLGDVWELK